MMQIRFNSLSLHCNHANETIDLDHHVLFFHGKVSSGKSSIARLINYCLGGSLEQTIAIQKELNSVALELIVGNYKVLLERSIHTGSFVTATCVDKLDSAFSINVPVNAGSEPVWANVVYSLSDLVFYLLEINVLRIPANKKKEDSGLVRISLKNFMWYCYLDQSKLDNSFFRHEDPNKARNSKEVLKYILQYSTQKLLELQEKYQQTRKSRFAKQYTSAGFRDFLKKFNFSSEDEIDFIAESTKQKLAKAKEERNALESSYAENTHFVDHIRGRIRTLIAEISAREEAIISLEERVEQQESLKSELVSSKFKFAKSESIVNVFQGVDFKNCPDCGTSLSNRSAPTSSCKLCLSPVTDNSLSISDMSEVVQGDLSDRIRELETSIDLHKRSLAKTRKEFDLKSKLRLQLDRQMQQELKQYESVFLSNIRAIDKKVATLQERLKGVERLKKMPQEINKLEEEARDLLKNERIIKQQIEKETANFVRGESLIKELEITFLTILNKVGMPGISESDTININKKTWELTVLPAGEDYLRWNFYNAGSGGKKTLFNSCFLIALHVVAARNDLPLPSFIMIDTPMKNIDKEVNQDIFKSFFDYLYYLASTVLDKTQIIIVDNNFVPPAPDLKLSFNDRYMASGDPNNPPLIPYYNGA
jgi:predicted nuclease with TOPRIM domain